MLPPTYLHSTDDRWFLNQVPAQQVAGDHDSLAFVLFGSFARVLSLDPGHAAALQLPLENYCGVYDVFRE